MDGLFRPEGAFRGLPRDGFRVFSIRERGERRRAIIDTFHPELETLGEDLLNVLNPESEKALHSHLPRLDWPRDYQPFCTWLALSHETQGYQSGPQLNVGVHADHVAIRLGWDVASAAFGRFEFLCQLGGLGHELRRIAGDSGLKFRIYGSAPWPRGSVLLYETPDDVNGSFDELARHGVWWELGRRHEVPADLDHICSAELGAEAVEIFSALLPVYWRLDA